MAWTIDKSNAVFNPITPAEQAKWDCFHNSVAAGNHPRTAAEGCGGLNYKKFQGVDNQYEIRLSKGTRASFLVNDDDETVVVIEVGGHA